IAAISTGEATVPSSPAARASSERCSTCPSIEEATPSSAWRAARSRLVSTVTATASGRRTDSSAAAAPAPSAAARIMARPPEAWTLNMNTPRRAASRAAPATVFGMSWNLRSRNTSAPRFWMASTAAGPAPVKSWEPILKRRTTPSSRSASRSASVIESTSSATMKRSRGPGGGPPSLADPTKTPGGIARGRDGPPISAGLSAGAMELLQRLDGDLALEQGLDAADGRLGAVHGRVVGNVLGHRGATDHIGILPRAAVLGRVEDEGDLPALHEVDDVRPVALRHLVDGLDGHALAGEELGRARRRHEGEAHVGEALGDLEHGALVAVLDGEEDLSGGGQGRACGQLRLDVGLAEVAVDSHHLARRLHLGAQHGVDAGEFDERKHRLLHGDVPDGALLRESEVGERPAEHHLGRVLGQGHPDGLGH